MNVFVAAWLGSALLLSPARGGDDLAAQALSPLAARAVKEFSQGQKAAACADSQSALQQDPTDERALGISKLTCGAKPIDDMDLKKRPQREPEEQSENIKLKTVPAPAASGQGAAAGGTTGETTPSQVIEAAPAGPSLQDQPTTYDKLLEAQSWLAQGRPSEAAEAARRAVELQPHNRRAFDALAESYRQLRNYPQLLYVAELGLQTFPNDPDLLKNKVFALIKSKDYTAALATAEQALMLHTTDPVLLALKAYALGRSGDRGGMIKALETAAALDPNLEPLLLDARRSAPDGEPFLLPGDSREASRPSPAPRRSGPALFGLAAFGGLIVLLLFIFGLLITNLCKKERPGPPPAEPPAQS